MYVYVYVATLKAEDPTYRETIVRWFQYGLTCPLLRQHGARDHTAPWFYGPEVEQLLVELIRLRAALKPYLQSQLDALNATGRPLNRPLMWDFPEDPKTWELAEHGLDGAVGVADQYMVGDDYMAAPVLELGQRSRAVYFPRGAGSTTSAPSTSAAPRWSTRRSATSRSSASRSTSCERVERW